MREVLGHLAGVDASMKNAVLVDEMPGALRRCNCAAAVADVKTLIWLLQGPDSDKIIRRPIVAARVALAATGASAKGHPGILVRAGATEPWSEVVQRVLRAADGDSTRGLRFVVGTP
jgi:hypothetical protein